MKTIFRLWILSGAVLLSSAQAEVSVSFGFGEPNYYGQIQLGDLPPPAVLYPNPIIIDPIPGTLSNPMYLRVPPGQYRHWSHYCARYQACNRPVYFVTDAWYLHHYVNRPPYYHRDNRPRSHWGRPHFEEKQEEKRFYKHHRDEWREEHHPPRQGHERHDKYGR